MRLQTWSQAGSPAAVGTWWALRDAQMHMEICPQYERCLAVLKLTELSVRPLRDASSANILNKAQQPTAFQLQIQWRLASYSVLHTIKFTVQVYF